MKSTHCYEDDGELYYDPFLDPIEDDEFYYWDPVLQRKCIGRRESKVEPRRIKRAARKQQPECKAVDQARCDCGGAP